MKKMKKMKTWRQKDGKEIPLKAMTNEHLVNAFRMCMRLEERSQRVEDLAEEMESRLLDDGAGSISDEDHAKIIDDCCVGGVDRYGSLCD